MFVPWSHCISQNTDKLSLHVSGNGESHLVTKLLNILVAFPVISDFLRVIFCIYCLYIVSVFYVRKKSARMLFSSFYFSFTCHLA